MKRSVWSCLALVAAAFTALACGSSDDRAGSPFGTGGPNGAGAGGNASGGTLAGGSPGSAAGGGTSGPGSCGSQAVNSGRITADILIVLDRSLSMKMNGVNRWDPSVSGIKSITGMLDDRVAFGLMTFPGPGARRGEAQTQGGCDPGTVTVPVQPNAAAAIASNLNMTQPGGFTPTAASLKAAREVIVPATSPNPDDRVVPKYVFLVTDGAPNCFNGMGAGGGQGTAGSGQPEAVEESVKEVTALTAAGVKTYVMGYDTQSDPALKTTLDRLATVGGTGEQQHRPIEDEASLIAAFRELTAVAITCDFELENTVTDAKFVLVKLDGQQIDWKNADGWILGGDNKTISLRGKACETVKQEGHTLSISVECEPVPDLF